MLKENKSKFMNFFVKNRFLIAVLFISLFFRIIQYSNNIVWWDSAAYIEMGKYIFSVGSIGLWEDSRPLVLSFILGGFWKLGINPVIAGKILMTFFSLGTIWLTYIIARKIFNENIAVMASLMLSFSQTFFFYDIQILTGIPSLFFALLGLYLFLDKRHVLSGLVLCIAFMTRFLQLGVFAILSLFLFFNWITAKGSIKKEKFKVMFKFGAGFSILFIPYLIFNYYLYSNSLLPFLRQAYMAKYTGWPWWEPFSFYFTNLFKENFLFIFTVLGLFLILRNLKKYNNHNKGSENTFIILIIFLFYFAYFTSIIHKEMRFALTFLPYLCMIASFGIFWLYQKLANSKKTKHYSIHFFIIVILVWLYITLMPGKLFQEQSQNTISVFQEYADSLNSSEGLWISSPNQLLLSDKKADELMYYPTFDEAKISYLKSNLQNAKTILLDTCDIPCPLWEPNCPKIKSDFIESFKKNFNVIYQNETSDCQKYIFSKNQ